jgi:hypothetical protein
MRFLLRYLFFAFIVTYANAQPKINETGKLLFAENDTVYYVYSPPNNAKKFSSRYSVRNIAFRPGKFIILNNNKIGWPGTHTYKTIRDSITIRTDKQQAFLFKATNGSDTISIYSNFVNADPYYNPAYKKKHTGVVSYEIPKVFELANILLALSDSGRKDDNLIFKTSAYYKEVIEYFGKFKTHAAVTFLDTTFTKRSKFGTYSDALNHAMGYDLLNGKIKPHKVYPDRWGQSFWTWQIRTLEDFARQSNFELFYRTHKSFYDSLISLQKKYMPVKEMWTWLENEFPFKYHSYKIIFSPLIGGSHSTDRHEVDGFKEIIMFVNSVLRQKAEKPSVMEGLMSGIVFTEIDHNYVNPVSDNFKQEINEIFSNRQIWAGNDGTDAANYNNATSVFNEYMTHSLFCLYASLKYSNEDFKIINSARQDIMNRRGFIKFKEFNERLMELYASKKQQEIVADLYPHILKWAKEVK